MPATIPFFFVFDAANIKIKNHVGIIEIGRLLGLSKHIVSRSIQLIFKELWDARK